MLVIYFSADSELLQWGEAPHVGDLIPGTNEAITAIEFYQGEQTVCLALARSTHGEGEHSFDVQLNPEREIINYGWSMDAIAPSGRLINYEPTDETLMRAIPSRWLVDLVDHCKPLKEGSYKVIYLCHCVDVPLRLAA